MCTTLPLEVFIQRNFVANFFERSWTLLAQTAISRFCATLWGLRGNVHAVHGCSMARWKARGRLPISANWTFFASYHGWGAMSRYWSKVCYLKGGSVTLNENFRGKGHPPPTIFGTREIEYLGYRMVKKLAEKFNRLSRVHHSSLYLATPLRLNPPTEGFPWDDLRKIFRGCRWIPGSQGTKRRIKIA